MRGNTNAVRGEEPASMQLHMRVTPSRKNRYVKVAMKSGMKMSEWMQSVLDAACDAAEKKD